MGANAATDPAAVAFACNTPATREHGIEVGVEIFVLVVEAHADRQHQRRRQRELVVREERPAVRVLTVVIRLLALAGDGSGDGKAVVDRRRAGEDVALDGRAAGAGDRAASTARRRTEDAERASEPARRATRQRVEDLVGRKSERCERAVGDERERVDVLSRLRADADRIRMRKDFVAVEGADEPVEQARLAL